MVDEEKVQVIARLNDAFRTTFRGGSVYVTAGIRAYGAAFELAALSAVRTFETFNGDNDPYQEHDFGAFEIEGEKLFWKIDCYDLKLRHGSPNPADQTVTRRVLTIMLASEY